MTSIITGYNTPKEREDMEQARDNTLKLQAQLAREHERSVREYYRRLEFGQEPLPQPLKLKFDTQQKREQAITKLTTFMNRLDALEVVEDIDHDLFIDTFELFRPLVAGRRRASPSQFRELWRQFLVKRAGVPITKSRVKPIEFLRDPRAQKTTRSDRDVKIDLMTKDKLVQVIRDHGLDPDDRAFSTLMRLNRNTLVEIVRSGSELIQ